MTRDLFTDTPPLPAEFQPGAFLLREFVALKDDVLLAQLHSIITSAPLRNMMTPGGFRMSVAMTNCGPLGWITDRHGYRYEKQDPLSAQPWPPMPGGWCDLARAAADHCGFPDFDPDACLINRYKSGARMSLHQDRNERDFTQPIVSVSLGLSATFLFGGERREDKTLRLPLAHRDVVVWGGASRLRFHGVLPIKDGQHAAFGSQRINLTFRRVL